VARRDPDFEIIELLPADGAPTFGAFAPSSTPADEPPRRPRWPIVAGVLAVAIVVVVAVVVSDGGDRRSTVPTTVPAPDSTIEDPVEPTRFLVDDPGLAPYVGDVVVPPPNSSLFVAWSDGLGASVWITAHARHLPMVAFSVPRAERRVVDGVELVASLDVGGATTVVHQIDSSWWVTVQASGLTDEEVARFTTHLSIDGARFQDGTGLLDVRRLRPVGGASTPDEVHYGVESSEVRYTTATDDMVTFRVSAAQDRQMTSDALRVFTAGTLVDDGVHLSGVDRETFDHFLVWFDLGQRFTISGPSSFADLARMAATVRAARWSEWNRLVYGSAPSYSLRGFSVQGSGDASDGSRWSAGVQLAQRGEKALFLWWWTLPNDPTTSDSRDAPDLEASVVIDQVVVPGATYVFVSAPMTGGGADPPPSYAAFASDGSRQPLTLRPVPGASVNAGVVRVDVPGPIMVVRGG
jgi:hypothetical protein